MKKLLLAVIAIVVCSTILLSFKAQQKTDVKPDIAVMRVFEPYAMQVAALVLTYGSGITETTEMQQSKEKYRAQNAEVLHTFFTRMKKEGYKLKAATGGEVISTYIFEKE